MSFYYAEILKCKRLNKTDQRHNHKNLKTKISRPQLQLPATLEKVHPCLQLCLGVRIVVFIVTSRDFLFVFFITQEALSITRLDRNGLLGPATEAELLKNTIAQAGFLLVQIAIVHDSMVDDDVVIARIRHLLLVVCVVLLGCQFLAVRFSPPFEENDTKKRTSILFQ